MDIVSQAVALLRERAYFSRNVDWDALGEAIRDVDPDAAIEQAVAALNDHHSFYIPAVRRGESGPGGKPIGYGAFIVAPDYVVTEAAPESPADRAGIQVGDVIEAVDGETPHAEDGQRLRLDTDKPVRLTLRREAARFEVVLTAAPIERMPLPEGRMLEDGIGYLALFAHGDPDAAQAYIEAAQMAIRDGLAAGARGWVVDLRRDRGGNMWPMLTGIGALLGDGLLGAFVDADDSRTLWLHRQGVTFYQQQTDPEPVAFMRAADPVPTLDVNRTPVAVLTSEWTDSSGEMTLIAFLGRPNTRTFGAPTGGDITGVATHELEDGSLLGIAEGVAADRTGRAYFESIQPDERVAVDWRRLGKPDDPMITAAAAWLRRMISG